MKKKLRTRLAGVRSAFPAAFSPYWHVLPLGRMKTLLAGYFFIGAAGGFAFGLLQLNASRVGGGFFWPVLVGMGATALRTAGIKRVRLIPLLFLLVVVTAWLGYWASHVRRLSRSPSLYIGACYSMRSASWLVSVSGLDSCCSSLVRRAWPACACRASLLWPTAFRRPWFRPSLSRTRVSSCTANRSPAQKWAAI